MRGEGQTGRAAGGSVRTCGDYNVTGVPGTRFCDDAKSRATGSWTAATSRTVVFCRQARRRTPRTFQVIRTSAGAL